MLSRARSALTGAVRALTGAGNDKQIIKKTYPKIDVNSDFDHRRNKVNDELEKEARKMAKDYLKSHNVDNEMVPSLRKYSGTIKDVLDNVAYAALQKYSVTINGITTDYTPPERKGQYPIDTLAKLVGGWFENDELGASVGGWHKRGSQISDKEAKVIFYFNFEKSKDNNDLLIWQGKLAAPPPPNPPPVVANTNEHLVQIKTATPMLFTLSNGRSFYTFDGLKIYPDEKLGSRAEIFHSNDWKYKPQVSGAFNTSQLEELQSSYVDTSQIDSSRAWAVTGGRKSTRRRQRRSNTRRIKQRKQSRKNHTRRRKSIRK
jgi:hypothetical protein